MSGVYEWVDEFQFSRSKKNIARDFSDAVLLAELIAQLFPAWVELHNYPSTHRIQQKVANWETLNRTCALSHMSQKRALHSTLDLIGAWRLLCKPGKVLTRIKCEITKRQQEDLANAVPGAIELLLLQVRKQTAKTDQRKAAFKTPVSPIARSVEHKRGNEVSATAFKAPQRYTFDTRTTSSNRTQRSSPTKLALYPHDEKLLSPSNDTKRKSPTAPRKPNARSVPGEQQSKASRSGSPALADFRPSPEERHCEEDITTSFSKILQLMSNSEGKVVASTAAVAATHDPPVLEISPCKTPRSPKSILRSLTPDHKQIRQPKPVIRARPASADSNSRSARLRAGNVESLSPTKVPSKALKVKQPCSPGRGYNAIYQVSMAKPQATAQKHAAKNEFAESSFVYFSCHEEPPADDEAHAWDRHECVQVARVVRSLASGDCLVQLFKAGASDSEGTTDPKSFKMFVSTPHFIECCGSQLHNIQNMVFDTPTGKWKWYPSKNEDLSASWKRDLTIDIAPGTFNARSGPKTEPAFKSRVLYPVTLEKKPSQKSHFFTEVLTRMKCNSISLEEPVAICATEHSETEATRCPAFIDTMHDAIQFETGVPPTVFPKVQVELALTVPEKRMLQSPKRRKSNASPLKQSA